MPATFSITVEGTGPMTYEWYYNNGITPLKIVGATTNVYKIDKTTIKDAGCYYAIATNGFGSLGSYCAKLTVNPIPGGSGTGLKGFYFDNTTLDGSAQIVRIDPQVDFDWGLTAPSEPHMCAECFIPKDRFSVRWYGEVYVPVPGSYAFGITTNDGGRLWVDGELKIDNWYIPDGTTSWTPYITFDAPGKHTIRYEYWEGKDNASAQLLWSGGPFSAKVIPQQYLFPLDFNPPTPNTEVGDMVWVNAVTGQIIDRISTIIRE